MRPKHARGNSQKNGSYSQGALRHLVFRSSEHNQNCVAYSRRSSGGPVAAQRARQGSARHSREESRCRGEAPAWGQHEEAAGMWAKRGRKHPQKKARRCPNTPPQFFLTAWAQLGAGDILPHACTNARNPSNTMHYGRRATSFGARRRCVFGAALATTPAARHPPKQGSRSTPPPTGRDKSWYFFKLTGDRNELHRSCSYFGCAPRAC